jgi:hypothetical protein
MQDETVEEYAMGGAKADEGDARVIKPNHTDHEAIESKKKYPVNYVTTSK